MVTINHLERCSSLLRKTEIEILQLNIGLYCNQACNHCHVESSPRRKEMMDRATAERCIEILKNSPTVHTLDLTGISVFSLTLKCQRYDSSMDFMCIMWCIYCDFGMLRVNGVSFLSTILKH